jgi:hypothetical protein
VEGGCSGDEAYTTDATSTSRDFLVESWIASLRSQ